MKIFSVSSRVSHAIFGAGTVVSAEKMGSDVLYEIEFDSGATKRLMGTFAKLKEI
jgi:DNA helicase-2/ATP-dependent DNA helicase PcrA